MKRAAVAVLSVAIVTLTACGSSTDADSSTGILTGGIYQCNGASASVCPPSHAVGEPVDTIAGTVTVSNAHGIVKTIRLKAFQAYQLNLPVGSYTVSDGTSAAPAHPVVQGGRVTTANILHHTSPTTGGSAAQGA